VSPGDWAVPVVVLLSSIALLKIRIHYAALLGLGVALAVAVLAYGMPARMAGASRARILRTITLPLVVPAIATAMLIVFIKAIGDFGVPSILGGEFQVLPTLIYYQIHGFFNLNAASAIAAVNVLLTLAAMALLGWVNRGRSHATLGGTAAAAQRSAHPAARLAGNAWCWLVIVVAVLPQLAVRFAKSRRTLRR